MAKIKRRLGQSSPGTNKRFFLVLAKSRRLVLIGGKDGFFIAPFTY
jgi:hypothetical protein